MAVIEVFIASIIYQIVGALPSIVPEEIGSPCGAELGDCPTLTCIPLSANCTAFNRCPGTCRDLDITAQQIYTLCGGWSMMDDCDERVERCMADPRHQDRCGPSCDGPGICTPVKDVCEGETGRKCGEGKVCFGGNKEQWTKYSFRMCFQDSNAVAGSVCGGVCFPLRFGSDYYDKSRAEEVIRTDQDGYQEELPSLTPGPTGDS